MSKRHERQGRRRYIQKYYPEVGRTFKAVDGADQLQRILGKILTRKIITANAFELPLKSTRLKDLLDAGHNCADYRSWLRGKLVQKELEDIFYLYGKLSCRTFTEERYDQPTPRLPVLYGVGNMNTAKTFCLQNNQMYHTLVNEFLLLEDSLYTGNLILLDDNKYLASIMEGTGTPRDVDVLETDVNVFQGGFGDQAPNMPAFIPEIANRFRNFLPKLRPITVEFSYYPYPVGLLKQKEVFWEWRGGSTHDIYIIVGHLMMQSSSYQTTLKIPR